MGDKKYKAYEWAQQNAASATQERFKKYGQKYTFADDIPKAGGPLFIKAHLQFNEVTDGEFQCDFDFGSLLACV